VEFIGYAARIASYNDTSKLGPYIIQQMFILLPPVLFAASIYMMLGRVIVALHGDQYSPIRPSRLTKTFLAGDIVCFYIQGGGGGLTAAGSKSNGKGINLAALGQWVVVGGVILQIIIFGLFCYTAWTFHKQYARSMITPAWGEWKQMMRMLYFVSGLIMVRSLFRVIETVLGTDGYLMVNEWPLYVFDSVLMFGVMVLFYFYYPSRIPGLVQDKRSQMRVTLVDEEFTAGTDRDSGFQLVEQPAQSKC
jgi:hypothetical protein